MKSLRPEPPRQGIAAPALRALVTRLGDTEDELVLSSASGAAAALAIATLLRSVGGLVPVLTPDLATAEQLSRDLELFSRGATRHFDVFLYPGWDVSFYDVLSPQTTLAPRRLATLHHLLHLNRPTALVVPAVAALKKTLPREVLRQLTWHLRVGATHSREELRRTLMERGYLSGDQVQEVGTLAHRGGVLDVFPPGMNQPVRMEFWGDEIESIRAFDVATQRSTGALEEVWLPPAREEILDPEGVNRAIKAFKGLGDQHGVQPRARRQVIEDLQQGLYFPDIEYLLPLFQPHLESLFDYTPPGVRWMLVEPEQIQAQVAETWRDVSTRYRGIKVEERLLPPPEHLLLPLEQWQQEVERHKRVYLYGQEPLERAGRISLRAEPLAGLRQTLLADPGGSPLQALVKRIERWAREEIATTICCHTAAQASRLRDLLAPLGMNLKGVKALDLDALIGPLPPDLEDPAPSVVVGELSAGFVLGSGRLALLSEEDIFGPRVHTSAPPKISRNTLRSFSQLSRGDHVVHREHGIGIFQGLSRMDAGQGVADFLLIEYQGGDKLYLPVHRVDTLQKYVGQKGADPTLDKLGGLTWQKTTRKVKESVVKIARELLDLYAARTLSRGPRMQPELTELESFEATFPWDETPDQLEAIRAVLDDMVQPQPMDRLLCGDVGFGKTEVALRAAWLAVLNGYQVAVLVPTTVLAFQHAQTFQSRFAGLPVVVEQISRFRTPTEVREILERVREGKVDILIGTHRLLSDDVSFKNLGLLVIDEEHRFGVKDKERLKKLRRNIHVLTMTATPIPRTLHMAVTGLRGFSIIATPPRDRLATRTYVTPFNPEALREAIHHELQRQGQIYFIHNRVRSLPAMEEFLHKLVPEARIAVAHGQQDEKELEKVMVQFVRGDVDILLCTSIVESGLDIPRANTMFINRADQFGLAQLYQLRGRVGRSDKRAYAYLLTTAGKTLSTAAERRLRTLERYTELGSGFHIATEDLEMRGAGNLLGESQSGNIAAVGFETYVELLQKTLQELSGVEVEEEFDPEVDVKVPAFIPDEYVPDLSGKLDIYRELAAAPDEPDLHVQQETLADRFGPVPLPLLNLIEVMRLRLRCKALRIRGLTLTAGRCVLRLDESSRVDHRRLLTWVGREPQRWKLTPEGRCLIKLTDEESADLFRTAKNLLHKLS